MMKLTHTPGPWVPRTLDGRGYWIVDSEGSLAPIAEIPEDRFERLENVRLIAAAPDMLETLRDIVGMLTDVNDMRADALHAARAAIVRATGGQA